MSKIIQSIDLTLKAQVSGQIYFVFCISQICFYAQESFKGRGQWHLSFVICLELLGSRSQA